MRDVYVSATTGFGTAGTGGFATPASGGLFGGTNTATPSGGLFGSQPAAFGAAGTGSSFSKCMGVSEETLFLKFCQDRDRVLSQYTV